MTFMKHLLYLLIFPLLISMEEMNVYAQNDAFNSGRSGIGGGAANSFNSNRESNFNDYRTSLNAVYAKRIRSEWNKFNQNRGFDLPKDEKPVPPVVYDNNDSKNDADGKKIEIDEIIRPFRHNDNVKPIAPVIEISGADTSDLKFIFMGTAMNARVPIKRFALTSMSNSDLGQAWELLSSPEYAPMVSDMIKLKGKYNLCDWAFILMTETFANQYCDDENSKTYLMAYLLSQAGYKVRLAISSAGLDLLFASRHKIFRMPYFNIDGEIFYTYFGKSGDMRIADAKFKGEQPVSLWIDKNQLFDADLSDTRIIKSSGFPAFEIQTRVNKNLIHFFDKYPTSEVNGNLLSRWMMYADTPTSDIVKTSLYPSLKQQLSGYSEREAVERLLNLIQTGFVYEYDDKVWGHDRAFFPEETLFYPYCDCEDRSILFTRLVRDILRLPCLLIYYPGHLAAAVGFSSDTSGDWISVNGKKYTITDPTYIGAPVGMTMPNMNNATAKVIVLE